MPADIPEPAPIRTSPDAVAAEAAPELGRALLLAQQVASETIAEAERQAAQIVANAHAAAQASATTAGVVPAAGSVLERLAEAFSDLERSLAEDLEDVARRLDAVRIQTGAQVALLLAELDRHRGQPTPPAA